VHPFFSETNILIIVH